MEKTYISLAVLLIVIITGGIHCDKGIKLERVRQGGTVTLPCDQIMTTGSHINWFRNCSHKYQPTLIISPTMLREEPMSRFTFVKTDGLESYDLQIKGVTAADVGVYFCANTEKKNGVEHYSYGTKITSVELIGSGSDKCVEPNQTTIDCNACPLASSNNSSSSSNNGNSVASLPECAHCWMMLYSLCAVCTLLLGILIIMCTANCCLVKDVHQKEVEFYSHGSQYRAHGLNGKHQCRSSIRGEHCLHTEVIYRALGSTYTHLDQ